MLDSCKATSIVVTFSLLLLWSARPAFGNVGGNVGQLVPCGSSSVPYTNAASSAVNIELAVTNDNAGGGCSDTLSWTDAGGDAQSVTVPGAGAISLSTSIEPSGALRWSSSGSSGQYVSLIWQIERAPAQSVSSEIGGSYCSSGTAYSNLTGETVNLDFAASAGSSNGCSLTFNWTDAAGVAHELDLSFKGSQGVSTSLPAGGTISWKSTGTKAVVAASWQIERVNTSQLW